MKQIICILILLGLIHFLHQMKGDQDRIEKFAATEGSQFNDLVNDLKNGIVMNPLKVTGNIIVEGNTNFHNYTVCNSWTGFDTRNRLLEIKDGSGQSYLSDQQTNSAIIMGGTNENGNPYWWSYRDGCVRYDNNDSNYDIADCAIQI